MSLVSDPEQSRAIGLFYGGYSEPLTEFEVALFAGDPRGYGVELDSVGGYAPQLVPNDNTTWPDAPADGEMVSAPVTFPDSTGQWTASGTLAVATHWGTRNPDTGDLADVMPLPGDGLLVDRAGVTGIAIQLIVNYADGAIG